MLHKIWISICFALVGLILHGCNAGVVSTKPILADPSSGIKAESVDDIIGFWRVQRNKDTLVVWVARSAESLSAYHVGVLNPNNALSSDKFPEKALLRLKMSDRGNVGFELERKDSDAKYVYASGTLAKDDATVTLLLADNLSDWGKEFLGSLYKADSEILLTDDFITENGVKFFDSLITQEILNSQPNSLSLRQLDKSEVVPVVKGEAKRRRDEFDERFSGDDYEHAREIDAKLKQDFEDAKNQVMAALFFSDGEMPEELF